MSEKSINIIGAIASIIALIITLLTLIFTEYKVISLVSLLIFETICILIWIYYQRQQSKIVYPYQYEAECLVRRYVFESATRMEFEVVGVYRVTAPHLSVLPLSAHWSGRGPLSIESAFLKDNLDFNFDGKTGEISFNFPLSHTHRFGETIPVHFRMKLEDASRQNEPHNSLLIARPVRLLVLETSLKYKEHNPPAILYYMPPSVYRVEQKEKEIPFDEATRSYRVIIPNPILGYEYRLKWKR